MERPELQKKVWIAHYIFACEDGTARTRTRKINAESYDAAVQYAAGNSPAEEFVVSVYPESDEQFLGLVRGDAMRMSGRGGKDENDDC